jgi:ferritin-like metal-binding protein YciE
MAFDDRERGFRRSRYNAEEDLRRGTIFDRSRRPRGNYDLPSQLREEDFDTGYSGFSDDIWDSDDLYSSGMRTQRVQSWWQVPGPFSGVGPRGYQRSDERILEEVCDRLMWHGDINAQDIEVQVRDREVVLKGDVEDRRSKHKAEEVVSSVVGIEDVHNQLKVRQRRPEQRGRAALPGISRTQMGQTGFQAGEMEQLGFQRASENLNNLEGLFFEELKDIYDGEKQILEALPKMERAAHNQDLRRGLSEHREQTQRQVQRLEQIFSEHGRRAERKHCHGVMGIIMEGEQLLHERDVHQDVRDAGLIAAAQKVEHYEIATYGTLRTFAQQLGFEKTARLLDDILNEESKANERLTSMAVGHINIKAKK